MKKAYQIIANFLFLIAVFSHDIKAQISSENGFIVPTTQTIRILMAFAISENDPNNSNDGANVEWPGYGLPPYAAELFDTEIPSNGLPTPGTLTEYYYQASHGAYWVLGDYIDHAIVLPYGTDAIDGVPNYLSSIPSTNPIVTAHGLTLDQFDLFNLRDNFNGEPKPAVPNNRIDVFFVFWRNHQDWLCGAGLGLDDYNLNIQIQSMVGIETMASFSACNRYNSFSLGGAEFFHGMFGGNNWHTFDGAGASTFFLQARSNCLTTQDLTAFACGYDRHHLGWKHPSKTHVTSAFDVNTNEEVDFGNYSIATHPDGGTYRLRDFVTTGDAIRIKLPHINWTALGQTKNQYIWLENHQKISEWDHLGLEHDCDNSGFSPGMNAYIQVGKDLNEPGSGVTDIFGQSNNSPNGLGNWLFPLSAEGRYDFVFYPNEVHKCNEGVCCSGLTIPYSYNGAIPNPFNGFQDGYITYDYNAHIDNINGQEVIILDGPDGQIGRGYGFDVRPGWSQKINGQTVYQGQTYGDNEDFFSFQNGNTKLSIASNPAPVPVYTWRSNGMQQYSIPVSQDPTASFENRKIYLNGLSIEIIDEILRPDLGNNHNEDPIFDIIVQIRWDDYLVDRNVRWCGDILLQDDINDPVINRQSKIELASGNTIILDRGESATEIDRRPDGYFTEPTVLTIGAGTKLHLFENSNLTIKNGSTLVIEDGAEVILENGACIVVEENSTLLLKGNNITLIGINSTIIFKGKLKTEDNVDFTFTGTGHVIFYPTHTIEMGDNSHFIIERPISNTKEKMIILTEGTELSVSDRDFHLTRGIVALETGSKMHFNNVDIDMTAIDFNGQGNSAEIEGNGLSRCRLEYCYFNNLKQGFKVTDQPAVNNAAPVLWGCGFTNCDMGLTGINLENIIIYNTFFSGFFETAVTMESVEIVNMSQCSINPDGEYINEGVSLKNVDSGTFGRTYISDCQTGLLATASNVSLVQGSEIKECNVGVDFVDNGTTGYMLSVGACGCAHIYNNNIGVRGDNIILDIDQIQHAFECDMTVPVPNRFDGNGKIFEICYTDPTFIPFAIPARVNYWGGQPIDAYPYEIRWNGCVSPSTAVAVNAAEFIDDINLIQNCAIIEMSHPPISINDYPLATLNKIDCVVWVDGSNKIVHQQSKLGFEKLKQEDMEAAEAKYAPVAYLSTSAGYTDKCMHKIYIARCIKEASNREVWLRSEYGWDESVVQKFTGSQLPIQLKITPNPAKDQVQIEVSEPLILTIRNVHGMTVAIYDIINGKNIDIFGLPEGVYIATGIGEDGNKSEAVKISILK